MTDKQIIDGVDVSRCENFSCGICEEENKIPKTINHFTADCRMYPNCYYKQLKRKEQECEELKEAMDGLLKIQYQLADSCNKYVQTLTKIKEIALGVRNYLACPSPRDVRYEMDIILQKISECEENNDMENN